MLRRPSASDPARASGGTSRSTSLLAWNSAKPFDSQLRHRFCGCRLEDLHSRMDLSPKVRLQSTIETHSLLTPLNGRLFSTRRARPIYPGDTEFEAHAQPRRTAARCVVPVIHVNFGVRLMCHNRHRDRNVLLETAACACASSGGRIQTRLGTNETRGRYRRRQGAGSARRVSVAD